MTTFALAPTRHRWLARRQATLSDTSDSLGESDSGLVVVGALLWLTALVRVLLGLWSHEVFGTEASLALMVILILPWLAIKQLREKWRRAHER
jgi:isoprenylcysteine carboxyl methyltransferase (ICMT) family protein YpbQ